MNASWRLDVPLNGDGRPSFAARAGRRKSWVRTRGESMQRRPSADNLFALDDERLVDRAGPFFQSTGRFNISRQAPAHTARLIYWRDWFHSLVNTRTHRIVVLVVLAYLFLFVVFATLYMVIDESCLPDIHRHRANCTDPAAPGRLAAPPLLLITSHPDSAEWGVTRCRTALPSRWRYYL